MEDDFDITPEEIEDFKELYLVQNYQRICQMLNKKGVKIRAYRHCEYRAG